MKYSKYCIIIMIVSLIVILLPSTIISADSSKKSDINIEVEPGDSLFNIENMKPGDWAPRSILVKNKGKKDFKYQVTVQNNGDEKLFKELMLEVNDDQIEFYHGKIANFTSPVRKLAAGSEEELQMTVRFPVHLGNDFQGLKTDISFIFTTRGIFGDNDEVIIDGSIDNEGDPDDDSKDDSEENDSKEEEENDGDVGVDADVDEDDEEDEVDSPIENDDDVGSDHDKDANGAGDIDKDVEVEKETGNGESSRNEVTNNGNSLTLPKTATNLFRLLSMGGILVSLGGWLFVYNRRVQ